MARLEVKVKFFQVPRVEAADSGVSVGWFSDQKYSDSTSIAQVARWNEFGTKAGIPERDFMRRTKIEREKEWEEGLKTLIQREIDKKNPDIEAALKVFGEIVKGDIQRTILAGGFKPNSKLTIEGGWSWNKKAGKAFYVKGKGHGKLPLIDTGVMVSSIQARTDKEVLKDV